MRELAFVGRRTVRVLAAVLVWSVLLYPTHVLPPGLALAWTGVVVAAFLHRHVVRPRRRENRRTAADLRLRPLGGLGLPVAAATLLGSTLALAHWVLRSRFQPVSREPILELGGGIAGHLEPVVGAIVVAPLIEEFLLRGHLQRPLERRIGTPAAVACAALLFALLHLDGWDMIGHFLSGVIWGYAVVLTRSIWAAVAMHAGANATWAAVALAFDSEAAFAGYLDPRLSDPALSMILLTSAAGLLWIARSHPGRIRAAHRISASPGLAG